MHLQNTIIHATKMLCSLKDTNQVIDIPTVNFPRNAIAQESREMVVERKTAAFTIVARDDLPPRSVSEESACRTPRESNLTSEVVRHSARFIRLCTASLHVDFSSRRTAESGPTESGPIAWQP